MHLLLAAFAGVQLAHDDGDFRHQAFRGGDQQGRGARIGHGKDAAELLHAFARTAAVISLSLPRPDRLSPTASLAAKLKLRTAGIA